MTGPIPHGPIKQWPMARFKEHLEGYTSRTIQSQESSSMTELILETVKI